MTLEKAQEMIDRAEADGWFSQPLDAPVPVLEAEIRSACTQALLQALDRAHRLAFILGAVMGVNGPEGAFILGISAPAFRRRLSRARARIRDFLSVNCGYFHEANRCRCAGVLNAHVKRGWIDPRKPLFVKADDKFQDPTMLRRYLRELDELSRISAFFKSVPVDKSSPDFISVVKKWIKKKNYRILSDPQTT